ncbi:13458_t:CDS:2 [Dentiscutata heterogama]|uniref:13458_t:CDS:1 n=1 Tax=Dentiscutata heterogama TaxID=1316150 RepID=A0ACA9LN06_9GLOM|nr:13458_t:CDS:2 [Dentiscutata heterogama]
MDDMEDLYVEVNSEAETTSTAPSASSANSLTRKKRKSTLPSEEVEESDSSTSEEDETPSGGSRRHWQYAHRQFRQRMQSTKGKGRKKNLVRIATILDPRFKDFKWNDTNEEKNESLKVLQAQYDSAKRDFQTGDIQQATPINDCTDDDDDFFQALERKGLSSSFLAEEDEVSRYMNDDILTITVTH